MRSSEEIIDIVCVEETNGKETFTLKQSLSLEALSKIISKSQESLKNKNTEPKRKLSGFSVRLRKMSDTTSSIVKRKISTHPEIRSRTSSFVEQPRQRKVSVQPDFTIGVVSIPTEKRVRKGSLQPDMLGDRRGSVKKDTLKARKMSVPANMKYNTERVRVRRVSFINQNTGEAFQMKKQ